MKKFILTLLLVMGLCIFTGCTYTLDVTFNDDGTYNATEAVWFSFQDFKDLADLTSAEDRSEEEQAMIDSLETEDDFEAYYRAEAEKAGEELYVKEIDGVKYFATELSTETAKQGEEGENVIRDNAFRLEVDNASQLEELLSDSSSMTEDDQALLDYLTNNTKYILTITFPEEVVYTNGTLSSDKKTVEFKFSLTDGNIVLYAYTADGIISLDTGDKTVTRKSKIKVVTYDKVKSITVNGKTQTSKRITLKEDGKYEIVVVTKNYEKSFTVIKDSVKPVVTGVEDGKTYKGSVTISYSDDGSGVKTAKLNGKKIKNGKKITKKGNYTLKVTDEAGNKITVKFTIE